jgi:hypothetical protein
MCGTFISPLPDRNKMETNIELMEKLMEAQGLSVKIVDFLIASESINEGKWSLALGIAYATVAKEMGVSLHDTIELVMTIHKNTEVIDD